MRKLEGRWINRIQIVPPQEEVDSIVTWYGSVHSRNNRVYDIADTGSEEAYSSSAHPPRRGWIRRGLRAIRRALTRSILGRRRDQMSDDTRRIVEQMRIIEESSESSEDDDMSLWEDNR